MNEVLEDLGGEDWIFDRIADGRSMQSIAEDLSRAREGFSVSRPYLYTWRDEGPHRERRRAKWAAAKEASAEAHLEDGREILDGLHDERGAQVKSSEVSLAQARAAYRRAMAEMRDPGMRTGGVQIGVAVGIGDQALEALRRRASIRDTRVLEGEVLAIEDAPEALPMEVERLPGLTD
jgi:hypothetical protein